MKDEKCKHEWEWAQNYIGFGKYKRSNGGNHFCKKCGVKKETDLDRQWYGWNHLTTRNGDYR